MWIDMKNNQYKALNELRGLPGEGLYPLCICKDPENGFWISVLKFYLRFDSAGTLIGHYPSITYFVSDHFCIDSASNPVIYYNRFSFDGCYILYFDLTKNEIEKRFKLGFSKNLDNIIKRYSGGGILIDDDNHLYVANAIEDKILKYNLSGELINSFSSKHVPFRKMKKDIPPGPEGVFEFLRRSNGKLINTILLRIGFISDGYLYAEYINADAQYIEIFSRDGTVINKETIKLPKGLRVVGSFNDYIYLKTIIIENMEYDEIDNPALIRYKYNS